MKKTKGQQSFLDDGAEEISLFQNASEKIDVVKMDYLGAESVEWRELFRGFSDIKAITYSSGIGFMGELLELFESAELIFGCEAVMTYGLQEVLAFQNQCIERLRMSEAYEKILRRTDAGDVKLYVARTQLSHEKLYLLSAEDGRKRVITGSANMSYAAFRGRQRENICYLDGEAAYDWYLEVFRSLRENSVDELSHRALAVADAAENIDALPVAQSVKVNKALVIEPVSENSGEVEFTLNVQRLAAKLEPMLPGAEKKTGKLTLIPDTVVKLKKHIRDDIVKTKELRSEYPQLVVDVFKSSVTLNDEVLNLSPTKGEIENDVKLFLKYMDGYTRFHGDYLGMQYRYFEFANWFFCSPFMAVMRDMAARYDRNKLPYPVFGLVYGQSKAGKTSFLETLLKMMIGQKPKIAAQDFTRTAIERLKRTVQGAPIIVDDMVNTRFNQHAIETIKTDDFGVEEHLVHYSAVVISANEDVKAVSPEVIRRTVICRVEAGLTNTEVMQSNVVRTVQKEIGTAFYREYLHRMLEVIPELTEAMKSDEAESAPDILKYSSEIIVSILGEYAELPEYIRPLSLDNYFSEQVTGKYAIKTIRTAWKTSKKSFHVDKRNNELRYNAGAPYEADRLIKELPETLEARKSRDWVVMNLSEAGDFFGIRFRKGLWS